MYLFTDVKKKQETDMYSMWQQTESIINKRL